MKHRPSWVRKHQVSYPNQTVIGAYDKLHISIREKERECLTTSWVLNLVQNLSGLDIPNFGRPKAVCG